MSNNLLNQFIEFVKEKYGMNIKATPSDNPDTFETIFGCVPTEKLSIPFGDYKIVAEINNTNLPYIPLELCVYICDKDNNFVQDICMVKQNNKHNSVDCLVWTDSDDENYTHKHTIGVYEEEE